MSEERLVSVVVPTYERPERLARLLDGLRRQTLAADAFEVIVVDDGSGLATRELLAAEGCRGGLRLRTPRHERNQGPSAGRNTGWRMAEAPLVAFTDDDCVPTPAWLESLLSVAGEHPGAFIQGPTFPEPAELGRSRVLARTVDSRRLGPSYQTCNIAYPRELLAALGGFDTAHSVGEDTDLAWRALEAGRAAVFAPEAVVHHAVERPGPIGVLREAVRWGDCAYVFARHPQARSILYAGLFWNVWHYLLVRSALALLAPAWLRRIVLARHGRALRRRARALGAESWAVPVLVTLDAVETGSMLYGAVRHRTPIL